MEKKYLPIGTVCSINQNSRKVMICTKIYDRNCAKLPNGIKCNSSF